MWRRVYVLGGKGKGTTMLDVLHSRPPKNAMFMFQHGNKSPDARDDSRKHTGNTGAGSTSRHHRQACFCRLASSWLPVPTPTLGPRALDTGEMGNTNMFSFPFLFCRGLNSRHQIPVSRVY